MKNIFAVVLAFSVITFLSFNHSFKELPIGSSIPQPDLKMKDVSGKETSLNDAKKANGLLVMFTCNTCPVVLKNQARTKEICQMAQEKNIGVILLNANEGNREDGESIGDMKNYATGQGYTWSYAVDKNSVMADAFGAMRTPENFLFDKDGRLVYHGAIDDNPGNSGAVVHKYLEAAIGETLSGKPVTIRTTRSIGCGIKRR